MNAVGYTRVSTEEQAGSGLGLAAQRAAILAEAERRGWTLIEVIEDAGYSGKDLKRPGIVAALDALRHHRADTLVVAKLDRLSRSLLDFSGILDRATREHWAVVALDLAIDTASPSGEMMANVLMTFARFERRLISERTKVALAQKVAQGWKPGRFVLMSEEVRARIVAEHKAGQGVTAIARRLNADGIATAQDGKRWYPSTVAAALRSEALGTPRKEQTDRDFTIMAVAERDDQREVAAQLGGLTAEELRARASTVIDEVLAGTMTPAEARAVTRDLNQRLAVMEAALKVAKMAQRVGGR